MARPRVAEWRPKPGRTACAVPFCRCTTGKKYREWVCGKHWRNVSRDTRAEWNRLRRRIRKVVTKRPLYREYWKMEPGCPQRIRAVSMWQRYESMWERCKREAIEAAVGIG